MTRKQPFTSGIYEDWMGSAQRKKIEQIIEKVDIGIGSRVLDVGSGPGFLCEFVDGVVAVDVDGASLARNKGVKVLASGDRLPFADSTFDAVFCVDTVHLLSGAGELARVLKKEGKAIVTSYCNEHNMTERMAELKNLFSDWNLLDTFYAGSRDKEMDAVIVCVPK